MTFALDDHWVWDFWLADDGDLFHMYYLRAPKALADPQLRHRNATIGHATSADLSEWTDLGEVLTPGAPGDFDGTATWTGSVVQAPDGTWRMFYTGSRFLDAASHANIETIGTATSADLHSWTKQAAPIIRADARWYETLGDSAWPEEAWRDPWVYADPDGRGWHMLVTARAASGDERDRGVIGHAVSTDLQTWEVLPPLSSTGAGFSHLEVPQLVQIGEALVLVFSCDSPALAGDRSSTTGGIWATEVGDAAGPFATEHAVLLASEELYSGKIIRRRDGEWVLLAFSNTSDDGGFSGQLGDPMPVLWDSQRGLLALADPKGVQ
ncbi:glycoside hydrolase family 68 protein [Galbitalea soli]|uniref:Glycosyl hydrolase family 32 n=1 Tax=Galbitalea soli TaxID=1268042 RepID=A0A7C9TSV0_9MICO|nr:glycoside hydrolase family 68 protein [Galbitalea soli]NEM92024.1 glycosyl hydrolase family 32 [Galbitalea soli]NYJ32024.1 beta-fructofuranosidase [Galbitalea soli]